jgi:hypothetical protein
MKNGKVPLEVTVLVPVCTKYLAKISAAELYSLANFFIDAGSFFSAPRTRTLKRRSIEAK